MTSDVKPVVVDPCFALEGRDLEDFFSEFGPFSGRYVPRFPNSWPSMLRNFIENQSIVSLPAVRRQRLLERIRRELETSTYPVNWQWDDSLSWADNVVQTRNKPLGALIVGHALEPAPFLPWTDAFQEIRESRRHSWAFRGFVSEYIDACTPLFLNSPSAYLVDPYLDVFSDAGKKLLSSLLETSKGSKCYAVEVITSRRACGGRHGQTVELMTFEEIERTLSSIYSALIPRDRFLRLHLVLQGKQGSEELRLHDRFFITRFGSINFGQGFLVLDQPLPQQNASVVSREHHERLKLTYVDGVARHKEKLTQKHGIPSPKGVHSIELVG